MSRVLANLLLIVAVLVQCSPLRVCEWSGLVVGHDCHDAGVVSVEGGGDVVHHGAGPVSGDENGCVCNAPKGMEEHGGGVSAGPDLAPFAGGPVVVWEPACAVGNMGVASAGDGVAVGPDLPLRMPLLI